MGWKSPVEAGPHDMTIPQILTLRNWTHRNIAPLSEGQRGFCEDTLQKERRNEDDGETLVLCKHFHFRFLTSAHGSVSQGPVPFHSPECHPILSRELRLILEQGRNLVSAKGLLDIVTSPSGHTK